MKLDSMPLAPAVALTLLLLMACAANVPPTITSRAPVRLDPNGGVYVVAKEQREEIVESLQDAGITLASDLGSMSYALEVRLGSGRGTAACGYTNNVAYILTAAGQRLMVIKGRGPTGSCEPSIFDEMSRELYSNLN